MNYIDVVLCRHSTANKPFLFQAPFCCGLKAGDHVVVETRYGEAEASVICVDHVAKEDERYEFYLQAAGGKHPLKKVVKKVIYEELIYKEGDEHERAD